jgi:hypothetical protein
MLYREPAERNMLPSMRLRMCVWFLALLAIAGALGLSSCMNQEGVGPGDEELHRPASMGGD